MSKARAPLKMPEKRIADAEAWIQGGSAKEVLQTPAPAEVPRRAAGTKLARLNVELSPELHRQFKTACAAEGMKMAEVVTELVQNWTDARRQPGT